MLIGGAVDVHGNRACSRNPHKHSGNELLLPAEVTADGGQVRDELVFQHAARLGVGRVDDRKRFGDGDRLGLRAWLQRDVHANVAADGYFDILALDVWKPMNAPRTV